MVEPLLASARQLLQPRAGDRLLDLYCGYGLFSHDLSDTCAEVVGVDVDRGSIQAARDQLRHSDPAGTVTFSCRDITPQALDRALPRSAPEAGRELVILDPPRQGTTPGVVPHVAARRPDAVLHIFCGIEVIPGALADWETGGYVAAGCIPLDMFPGTPNLETLVLLHRSSSGKRAAPS
jgi:tRNA/tmRNA/rRNA uracil-C5-methylase (TrmA/RlmC/RlmD family)